VRKLLRLALLLAAAIPASAGSQERLPIIDMHMHALTSVSRDENGQPRARPCSPRPCEVASAAALSNEDLLRVTLEAMDQYNIVLGFLSGSSPDSVKAWIAESPGRFIGGVFFSPSLNIDDLRKEYESGVLLGVGELGPVYLGISIDDPQLEPYFQIAEDFDLPVLIHLQGIGAPRKSFRIRTGHPELLEEVLRRHPTIRVYLENAGFPFFDETLSLMYMFPQVYGDLSTITWLVPRPLFYDYFERLVGAGLDKRLMFGSDQMNWPEVIGEAIAAIESAPFLNAEQRRDIFYNNAARFLRLSDEEIAAHHDR